MHRSKRFAELALLLLLAAPLAACVTAPRTAAPAAAPAEVAIVGRLLAAADARSADTALVEAGLAHAAPAVRRVAASVAGNLRMLSLAPHLAARARDGNIPVERAAAFALALLRDTAGVARLDSLVSSSSPEVARAAAWGLGELGEPARGVIERRLGMPSAQSEAALAELLLASARLRPVPAALVMTLLAHPDADVEWSAAYALARSRVPAGARALAARVSTPNPLARFHVARGLAHGTAGDSLADLALAALRTLAADPHPHVRVSAARSLATYASAGRAPLLALARDADPNVRIAAVQALPPAMPLARATLDSLWLADSTLTYRRAVLAVLARAHGSLGPAASWSRHADWQRRVAALEGIALLPAALAVPQLRAATSDEDGRVRAAAVGALAAFADSAAHAPAVLASLRAALADADWQVRAVALGALARRARTEDAVAAASLLRASQGEAAGGDARTAAAQLLAALWRRDSVAVPAQAVALVRSIAPPPDVAERAAASTSSLFAHWRPAPGAPLGTPRPAAWYEEVASRRALAERLPAAVLRTTRGSIELELFAHDAPLTVENFVRLAASGYYRNTSWHRVVPAFVAQDGDPRGDGSGGPGYAIRDEQNPSRYHRGVLGMALSGPNTGGSQYFITLSPQPHLDGHYTVFGRVLRGLEVLDALVQGDTLLSVDVR